MAKMTKIDPKIAPKTEKSPKTAKNRPKKAIATLSDWESSPFCVLCGSNAGLERHHKVFRSRGGKEGDNLVLICKVCHAAAHGVPVVVQGHSCRTCRVLEAKGCHFGEKLLGLPVVTDPPWEER